MLYKVQHCSNSRDQLGHDDIVDERVQNSCSSLISRVLIIHYVPICSQLKPTNEADQLDASEVASVA